MSRLPPIRLRPLAGSAPAADLVDDLANRLAARLAARVAVGPPFEPPTTAATRDSRLDSNAVVDALVARESGKDAEDASHWTLALTTLDLAAPGRDFVFGEATLGGAWALVSTARLATPGDDPDRLRERLLKEAVHELGHLAGLDHCRRPSCVMHPSTTTAGIDRKNERFCDACDARLRPPDRS